MDSGTPFASFPGLSAETRAVLASQGFLRATPVQEATLPLFLGHADVCVQAATGCGKTLAFVLPVAERLRALRPPLRRRQVGALIVSPTRELARQTAAVAAPFLAAAGLTAALLVGGSDPSVAAAELKTTGAHVLIGTPGRLDDALKRTEGALDLRSLEVLVLDEADRLLDMGFRAQLDAIIARLPRQRRTGLFSATQTEAVEALARAGLRNPVRVAVAVAAAGGGASSKGASKGANGAASGPAAGLLAAAEQATPASLAVTYTVVAPAEKLAQLAAFLAARARSEKVIVYFLTCACVDFFAAALPRLAPLRGAPGGGGGAAAAPVAVRALHGRMKQAARERELAAFAAAGAGVLLATDVAARGLDIPHVDWVVQYDAPQVRQG
jgi:ATP-dependent RNA helicase DDX55/SPB4